MQHNARGELGRKIIWGDELERGQEDPLTCGGEDLSNANLPEEAAATGQAAGQPVEVLPPPAFTPGTGGGGCASLGKVQRRQEARRQETLARNQQAV